MRGLSEASAVACSSEATGADARRLIGNRPRPEISVISLGPNYTYKRISADVVRARFDEAGIVNRERPFVLHVGSNLIRKNRDGVLRIFARAQDAWDGELVFVGEPLTENLRELAADLKVAEKVKDISNASDALLEALYSSAVALLYPSRSEGFGWPIIEAQACGCPVVCSNVGPIPNVAGDAGLFHSVEDEAGFAADLLRLTNETDWNTWSEKSLRNAERFSAERMITEYTELYQRLGWQP